MRSVRLADVLNVQGDPGRAELRARVSSSVYTVTLERLVTVLALSVDFMSSRAPQLPKIDCPIGYEIQHEYTF